jgi:hypothetical protein
MSISYFNLLLSQRGTEQNKPLNLQCFTALFSAVEGLSRSNRPSFHVYKATFFKSSVGGLPTTAYRTEVKQRRSKAKGASALLSIPVCVVFLMDTYS